VSIAQIILLIFLLQGMKFGLITIRNIIHAEGLAIDIVVLPTYELIASELNPGL